MSMKWPGGLIRKTPVTPTGPFQNGTAPGMWTMAEAAYWLKQGLWPIAGNEQLFVENVFSTYLITGNNSTQTINNGINLTGKGGLVWQKPRNNSGTYSNQHKLWDTVRGAGNTLYTDSTQAQETGRPMSFTSSGFSLDAGSQFYGMNETGINYASWTFREAPNFFDVVTYTGNGVNGRQIAHNLGVTPGFIIYKCTSTATSWLVLHRSLPNGFSDAINLNTTDAAFSLGASFAPTATTFTMSNGVDWNQNGQTYVAYLFAHSTASDGIIQCGSFTTDGSGNATVNLGWEPQFIIGKSSSAADPWYIADIMRGMPVSDSTRTLRANSTLAEQGLSPPVYIPNATGFSVAGGLTASTTYIYIAIRRGPMQVPTVGTTVFSPIARTGTGTTFVDTTNFPVDSIWFDARSQARGALFIDRLRGFTKFLQPNNTNAENTNAGYVTAMGNTEVTSGTDLYFNDTGQTYVDWCFRRAPSFFDEVCYTGTGSTVARNHNLGVAPELAIFKSRSGVGSWLSWSTGLTSKNYSVKVNLTNAQANEGLQWIDVSSTTFTVDGGYATNGTTYVAYLFASCPGVSKVGSYTGTGALQTINCGFTTGARFVLIKRTDSTGDWYVWDSARGITSGNDPYLLLNSTAAEVTGTNYVDTDTTGFQVTAAAPAGINANGGSYIFLAVA